MEGLIIVEDDLIFSPDFLTYFQAGRLSVFRLFRILMLLQVALERGLAPGGK